jgi:hypothetical protein
MKATQYIQIEGGQVPFSFGMAALAQFCDEHGMTLADFSKLGENMEPKILLSLLWYGIKDGHRKERKDFSYTITDVGDLLDEHPAFLEKAMDIVAKSMPGAEGNAKAPTKAKR